MKGLKNIRVHIKFFFLFFSVQSWINYNPMNQQKSFDKKEFDTPIAAPEDMDKQTWTPPPPPPPPKHQTNNNLYIFI